MRRKLTVGFFAGAVFLVALVWRGDIADRKGDEDASSKKGSDSADDPALRGTVTGTVTYDGKIVPVGYINFHPEKGIGVIVPIQNGKYAADKVPVGPVTVTVRTAEMRSMYTGLKQQRSVSELLVPGGGQLKDKLKKEAVELPGEKELARQQKEAWEAIKDMIDVPEKFADPRTSSLKYEIKPGSQQLDIAVPKDAEAK